MPKSKYQILKQQI